MIGGGKLGAEGRGEIEPLIGNTGGGKLVLGEPVGVLLFKEGKGADFGEMGMTGGGNEGVSDLFGERRGGGNEGVLGESEDRGEIRMGGGNPVFLGDKRGVKTGVWALNLGDLGSLTAITGGGKVGEGLEFDFKAWLGDFEMDKGGRDVLDFAVAGVMTGGGKFVFGETA